MVPFKDRTIEPGQRVKVYRNLNKKGVVYSVKDAKTGLVLGHSSTMVLRSCTFDVQPKGRERVVQTGKKNVHAYIVGNYKPYEAEDEWMTGVFVKYNPYNHSTFVRTFSLIPIKESRAVRIKGSNIVATL